MGVAPERVTSTPLLASLRRGIAGHSGRIWRCRWSTSRALFWAAPALQGLEHSMSACAMMGDAADPRRGIVVRAQGICPLWQVRSPAAEVHNYLISDEEAMDLLPVWAAGPAVRRCDAVGADRGSLLLAQAGDRDAYGGAAGVCGRGGHGPDRGTWIIPPWLARCLEEMLGRSRYLEAHGDCRSRLAMMPGARLRSRCSPRCTRG